MQVGHANAARRNGSFDEVILRAVRGQMRGHDGKFAALKRIAPEGQQDHQADREDKTGGRTDELYPFSQYDGHPFTKNKSLISSVGAPLLLAS